MTLDCNPHYSPQCLFRLCLYVLVLILVLLFKQLRFESQGKQTFLSGAHVALPKSYSIHPRVLPTRVTRMAKTTTTELHVIIL